MGLKCRKWKQSCTSHLLMSVQVSPYKLQTSGFNEDHKGFSVQILFSVVVAVAGIVALVATVLSLKFFNMLLSLTRPSFVPSQPNGTEMMKCIFQTDRNESKEFLVSNIRKAVDCENFLFNIMNYSLMQCVILFIGASVSLIILSQAYLQRIKNRLMYLKGKHVHKEPDSSSIGDSQAVGVKKRAENNSDQHLESPVEEPERASDDEFSCEHLDKTPYCGSDFTNNSPDMNQMARFRHSKDGGLNQLPGVIIEDNDNDENTL